MCCISNMIIKLSYVDKQLLERRRQTLKKVVLNYLNCLWNYLSNYRSMLSVSYKLAKLSLSFTCCCVDWHRTLHIPGPRFKQCEVCTFNETHITEKGNSGNRSPYRQNGRVYVECRYRTCCPCGHHHDTYQPPLHNTPDGLTVMPWNRPLWSQPSGRRLRG